MYALLISLSDAFNTTVIQPVPEVIRFHFEWTKLNFKSRKIETLLQFTMFYSPNIFCELNKLSSTMHIQVKEYKYKMGDFMQHQRCKLFAKTSFRKIISRKTSGEFKKRIAEHKNIIIFPQPLYFQLHFTLFEVPMIPLLDMQKQ